MVQLPGWEQDQQVKQWVDWLIDLVGETLWKKRKKQIVQFIAKTHEYSKSSDLYLQPFKPEDLASWYLYICECYINDPVNYDIMQGARVIPMVKCIMRDWEKLRNIKGIENRLRLAFINNPIQFDDTLFEILVTSNYIRNGWNIEFLEESAQEQRPDIKAEGNYGMVYIECKRKSNIKAVDLNMIQHELKNNSLRIDSTRFLYLLLGYNELWRGVTYWANVQPSPTMPNVADELKWGAGAIWSCDSEESINAKARYLKRELAKAIKQFPDNQPGIFHWGFELYDGEQVKEEIYKKTLSTIHSFDFGLKDIKWIYTHIFEFMVPPDKTWDANETCHWFMKDNSAKEYGLEKMHLIS
jgi:hypothetical protein